MDTEQYPSIRELSLFDMTILKALKTLNWDQKQQMRDKGYMFYEKPQLERIFSSPSNLIGPAASTLDLKKFNKMTADDKERLLEEDIRKLAKMGTTQEKPKLRTKRAARVDPVVDLLNGGNMTVKFQEDFPASDDDHNAGSIAGNNSTQLQIEESGGGGNETNPEGEGGKEQDLVEFEILNPTAFRSFVGEGFTWEVAVLSPEAFIFELLDPDFMVLDVLSPKAFWATILSPGAFIARTLSPTALRAEVGDFQGPLKVKEP
ncbi:unnamed protein product, partial [Mesorhabditis spiculigera]